ncbi:MAG: glycosyltransferase, partial [Aigarchaeota archaeon]|nr:glycosyltransferase [Candidatus Pelearchaeum maunauluense]
MSFLHFTVTVIFFAISSILPLYTLAYFHLIFSARKYRKSSTKSLDDYPVVTVQLPIYNERYVVGRLLESVCMLDYPRDKLQIIVVDDSDDETAEICGKLVEHYRSLGYWIMHLRRGSRAGYKAGALQEALKHSRGEFIAIFDADFAPPRDFLKKALQHFTSDDIGLVQARWGHLNRDYSALTAAQALSLDLHFKIEQAGRNASGLFINFNGTAGVWRKKCIEDSGGWLPSLAEDLDLSYRAQLRGWRLVYIDDLEAPAELPVQMNASRRQQYRWAFGSFQTALRYVPEILAAKISALTKIHAVIHL